ncbi:MAG: efflux RND transporter permease subunit [Chloroflexi bacterium]|nr:efflux RND transporter permease subunit [Chloroflexota bacterium]
MRKLAEICIRRPVFAAMLILALVVVGSAGYLRLGVDRFPSVDLPTVRVSTRLPGAAPAEVEAQISQPIEENINTIEGIKELRSINGSGISLIIVTFELDRDIDAAAQDVRDRVATVIRELPREADPPVISKADNDLSPVMTIAVSGERSLRELTEIADKIVKVQLERSAGVGEVEIVGGLERAISVWIDADRLAAYQIPITQVREAISRQNANVPGGFVTSPLREHTLRTMGRITDPKAFNDLVVATRQGAPVRVRDLGWAEDGTKEQRSVARLNGVPSVTLEIRRQSGANTVAVIEGVKARFAAVQAQLPADVKLEVIRDQSRYIYEALHEINQHLIMGSLLASVVVLAFMRNVRATLIAAVAIPTSVLATFGMMRALDFTLNGVTMLALVLMVGIVIDDAIVVLENIFRFVEEKKLPPFAAARAATAEIALPVMATTFSLVVIFVPVSFMSSISGRFLFQFGITAAAAVLVSLLVSFTLTPMMSARLLRAAEASEPGAPRSRRGFYGRLDRTYAFLLALAMRHRLWIAGLATVVILSAVPLYKLVKQEYIPGNVDEGEFDVSVLAPEGTSLAAMNEVAQRVEADLRAISGIQLVLTSAGGGGFMGSVNNARFYVRLTPHAERTFSWRRLFQLKPWRAFQGNFAQRDVMQEVRRRLKKYPDLRMSLRNPQTINLGGPNFDIDFSLLGPDLETLAALADQLRKKAPDLGLLDADTTLKLDKPELRVEIDRERAARLGVDTADIATALRIMVGGDEKVSRFRDASVNDDYDVQLRLSEGDRNDPNTIARLYVPRAGGGLVRLDNLVQIVPAQTASRIDRLDRQRAVSLRTAIAPGYALADRLAALRAEAAAMNLPPGYSTRVSGKARELESTFTEFIWAFLLSVILMYIILASQFESLVHPFTMLWSLPLSVPFALFSLWITGHTLNLYSALGMLVLFGVVKKNAILQIDHMNNLRAQGLERLAAILQANRDRLRPILMTTLALVAGMLPLALGTGPGAEERRPIAVVVIGGQTLSLLLTLIVTPVAYSYLDDLARKLHWRRLAARLPWKSGRTQAPSETPSREERPAPTLVK